MKLRTNVDVEMVHIIGPGGRVVKTLPREEAEAGNHTTANVLIFIFNSTGQVLISRRAPTKKFHPNAWDISAAGGIAADEDPALAACREVWEETGIQLGTDALRYVETFLNVFEENGVVFRRLSRLYIATSDDTPMAVDGEASEFKFWKPEALLADAAASPKNYVPSFIAELQRALAGRANLGRSRPAMRSSE